MEHAMTEFHDVRRHRDGSINFDFYRKRAATLRAEMLREGLHLSAGVRSIVLTAASIVVSIAAAVPLRWI
jgi:hypothetical protein